MEIAKDRISKLEDKTEGNIQAEVQRNKRIEDTEKSKRDVTWWKGIMCNWCPEEKRMRMGQ